MPQSRLVKYVPNSVVFQREPLTDEQNAYWPWLEATKCYYKPPDEDEVFWSLVYPDSETGEGMEYPSGKEAERVGEILEKNRRAFELIEEGISRKEFQSPESEDIFENEFEYRFTHIILFSYINVRRLLSVGRHDAAVRTCLVLSRMTNIIEESAVSVTVFLAPEIPAYRRMLSSAEAIVDDNKSSNGVLQELLEIPRQQNAAIRHFTKSLKYDLCYDSLSRLDRVPEKADVAEIVDAALREYYNSTPIPFPENNNSDPAVQADREQRLAWRRDKIISLLEGHACPFDKQETARLYGDEIAAMEASFQESLTNNEPKLPEMTNWPSDRVRVELESWPPTLSPQWIDVDTIGDTPSVYARIKELNGACECGAIPPPPTPRDLAESRKKIASVVNPLGKLLFSADIGSNRGLCNFRLEINTIARKLEDNIMERLQQ